MFVLFFFQKVTRFCVVFDNCVVFVLSDASAVLPACAAAPGGAPAVPGAGARGFSGGLRSKLGVSKNRVGPNSVGHHFTCRGSSSLTLPKCPGTRIEAVSKPPPILLDAEAQRFWTLLRPKAKANGILAFSI